MPLAAASSSIQGINMALNGILRSQGRQSLIARIRIASFAVVAVPLSAVAVAVFHWRLAGLWFGYLVNLAATLVAQLYFILTTDWHLEIERCRISISKALLHASLENDDDDDDDDNDAARIDGRQVLIM
ncbi:hypothetical protein GGI11_002886 [Coemansia sp. RSA 2049]|nr:hypothetical protein GGI11_002886 [Coemansia sp. RSA 2049]